MKRIRLCLFLFLTLSPFFYQATAQQIRELQQKLELAKRKGDGRQASRMEVYLGNAYFRQGERGNATKAFRRALAYSEAEQVTKGYAYWGLANNAISPDQNYQRGIRAFQLGQEWELYYKVLDDAGAYYLRKEQFSKAEEAYEKMRNGALTYGFTDYVRRANAQLEKVYNQTGQTAAASRVHRERRSSLILEDADVNKFRNKEQELDSIRTALDSMAALALEDSATRVKLMREKEKIEADLQEASIQKELAVAQAEKEAIRRQDAEKLRNVIIIAGLAVAALLGFILIIILRSNRKIKRTNKEVLAQKQLVEEERAKSDKLLLNILPEPVANELKENGSAAPQYYNQVTVMFTDFKGFTQIAEKMSPQALITELEEYFLEFDAILERHNLEKIKTIGDAYMCAGGLPVKNDTNPEDAVKAGLDMQKFMERKREEKEQAGKPYFRLRVGIHTGALIAGVVGRKKFAYDIWGDTVNIAARMEQSGEPDKVNISGETYELIKDKFNCTYRGKIAAKNKGEVDMYFVEGIAWNAVKEGRIKL